MTSVITLLTDYGLEDGYVAACHGVIAGIAPEARVIDVCHAIPSGDVRRGAAILAQTIPYLPKGVHIGAVDPGTGHARRPVAIVAGGRVFIGPDNGLLSWAVHASGGPEAAYEISNEEYFLRPVSPTFHGRDIYSAVAGRLVKGLKPDDLGPERPIARLVSLAEPMSVVREGAVEGEVVSVDRYGNTQLSITASHLEALGARVGDTLGVWLGRRQLTLPYRETYAAVPPGELVAFADSAGLIAIAVNSGDAAQRLGLPPGAHVRISPSISKS
ncbi:SAM-dependent chlorinase/fluorinase [Nonomuraea roseoviolacea subsp. roseoviolacea]|uniref:S-adenosylmethionine hydrolase n=1 Tax=Nonomuraea roseoviolacea subsp. carminata TaxID=160689 RepID=A0ABT1K2X8_9ACTN|nr:SAM-dependent chlorinase/fluorinase [Nonomuraea roseoviolacea]MCP2347994.1 S-adenosylmethionine hydrolase [Nonomuraea roseoviolacea subsp. carminata]